VACGWVDREGTAPAAGDVFRATWIDQPVTGAGQDQRLRRRVQRGAEPRRREQLPEGVPQAHGPRPADGDPFIDDRGRRIHKPAGELEDERFALPLGSHEQEAQQGQPSAGRKRW